MSNSPVDPWDVSERTGKKCWHFENTNGYWVRQQLQRIKCKDEKMYISMADNDYEAMIGQELVSQSPQFPVTWTPKILTKVEHQGVSNPALTHPL